MHSINFVYDSMTDNVKNDDVTDACNSVCVAALDDSLDISAAQYQCPDFSTLLITYGQVRYLMMIGPHVVLLWRVSNILCLTTKWIQLFNSCVCLESCEMMLSRASMIIMVTSDTISSMFQSVISIIGPACTLICLTMCVVVLTVNRLSVMFISKSSFEITSCRGCVFSISFGLSWSSSSF